MELQFEFEFEIGLFAYSMISRAPKKLPAKSWQAPGELLAR